VARYRLEGEAAFEALSRARASSPAATPAPTVELVLRDLTIDPRRDYQPTGRPPGPPKK